VVVIEPSQAVGARIEDTELRCARTRVTLVSEVQALLRRTGVTMETEERIGDAAEQILSASKERAADLIAVGRGEHWPLEPLRRRVWDRVVPEAKLPVLVVP
jgi:nucleotide-binding universal stress UspA family protein